MTYKKITGMISGRSLPTAGHNEHGEPVVIDGGSSSNGKFFRLTTAQSNGWCRINTYYENGISEETYRR